MEWVKSARAYENASTGTETNKLMLCLSLKIN